jgi:NADPH-dependent F420 reductase
VNIGVLGATGPAGLGLVARLADAGYRVVAGSRDRARAEAAVAGLRQRWGDRVAALDPADNASAVAAADVVVIATTWDATVSTASVHARSLAGKVVVSMANGLERVGREFRPVVPPEGSLAQAVQAAVPGAHVVAAFQHIPASAFAALDEPLESDVLVCSDHDAARRVVIELVEAIPVLRPFDAGPLANAVGLETFAAALLTVNLRHRGLGKLRLVGVEPQRSVSQPASHRRTR